MSILCSLLQDQSAEQGRNTLFTHLLLGVAAALHLPQCCSRLLCHCRVGVVKVEPQQLSPHGLNITCNNRSIISRSSSTSSRQGSDA
jgi:hypothetical protein